MIDRRVTIMIDALDEAASGQGDAIAARLIVPLGQLERVRVLVGSRRSVDGTVVPQGEDRHSRLRAVFGTDAIIDDLEDEQETREDIAEYVRLRLAASPRHRNNPIGIATAAERAAVRAEGVFLYARIVSRTLRDLDRLDGERRRNPCPSRDHARRGGPTEDAPNRWRIRKIGVAGGKEIRRGRQSAPTHVLGHLPSRFDSCIDPLLAPAAGSR
jgi:hypothetical protein